MRFAGSIRETGYALWHTARQGRGHDEETAAQWQAQSRTRVDLGVACGDHRRRAYGRGMRIVVAGPRTLGVECPKHGGIGAGQRAGVLRHTTGERGAHGLRQPRPVGQRQRHCDRELDGGELRSGTRAYQVNDRNIVALHTATPLYRDLKVGDRGEDVRSLNDELGRLGYDSVPQSAEYNWNTGNGWRQLMVDVGNSDGVAPEDMDMRLSDTMWIPEDVVNVRDWTAVQGSNVQAGAALGMVPGGLVKLAIRNGSPSDKERTLTVFGVAAPLPAGSTEITDAGLLAQIAATEGYQGKTPEERAAGMDAQLTLNQAIQTLRVPAGAVFGTDGASACIATGTARSPETVPVRIITSELGASLVQPEHLDVKDVHDVLIGPTLATLQCG